MIELMVSKELPGMFNSFKYNMCHQARSRPKIHTGYQYIIYKEDVLDTLYKRTQDSVTHSSSAECGTTTVVVVVDNLVFTSISSNFVSTNQDLMYV